MKKLELNQMINVNGGMSERRCRRILRRLARTNNPYRRERLMRMLANEGHFCY